MVNNQNSIKHKKENSILLIIFVILLILTSMKLYNRYFNNISKNNLNKTSKEFSFKLDSSNNNMDLKGLNGEVKLEGYDGNELILKSTYIPKEEEYKIDFYKDKKGKFILSFEDDKFKEVSIDVLVPKGYFKDIDISSVNSNNHLEKLSTKEVTLKAFNGDIVVEEYNGEDLIIDNMNGSVSVKESISKNIDINNMNANITLNNCDIKNLDAKTINGGIEIIEDETFLAFEDYNWELENQNGAINLSLASENIDYNIEAKTSNGKIELLKDNLIYSKKSENKIAAETEKPNKSYKRLNLSLETTNSSIVLK